MAILLKERPANPGEASRHRDAADTADARLVFVQAELQALMADGFDAPPEWHSGDNDACRPVRSSEDAPPRSRDGHQLVQHRLLLGIGQSNRLCHAQKTPERKKPVQFLCSLSPAWPGTESFQPPTPERTEGRQTSARRTELLEETASTSRHQQWPQLLPYRYGSAGGRWITS